jgi:hypothetical protein
VAVFAKELQVSGTAFSAARHVLFPFHGHSRGFGSSLQNLISDYFLSSCLSPREMSVDAQRQQNRGFNKGTYIIPLNFG